MILEIVGTHLDNSMHLAERITTSMTPWNETSAITALKVTQNLLEAVTRHSEENH